MKIFSEFGLEWFLEFRFWGFVGLGFRRRFEVGYSGFCELGFEMGFDFRFGVLVAWEAAVWR